jgi:small conductance mechanosensitive channel
MEEWRMGEANPTIGQLWRQFLEDIRLYLTDTTVWFNLSLTVLRILVIVIIGRILLRILHRIIDRATGERRNRRSKHRARRVQTVGRLAKNAATYVINFIIILLVLGEFRLDLAPLLAGAGVAGLAIGFGAQSLVKDVISGFFVLMEDQFAVGDVVRIGNATGTVEMIGLRSTRLRSWTGEVHIIPNGSIGQVTNYSIHNTLAIVDVTVPPDLRMDEAAGMIRSALARFDDPGAVGKPELLGLHAAGAAGIVLRVTVECRQNQHFAVARKLSETLRKTFEERGLEPPYPQIAMVSAE